MSRRPISMHRIWLAIFGIWAVLLSGLLTPWVGSPGVLQLFRLQSLLSQKQDQAGKLESNLLELQAESERLQGSRIAQEREIRKTLGYAADDEMIFDFSTREPELRASLSGSARITDRKSRH